MLLELHGITRRFGAIEALRGIDLAVDRGEVLALLGDNGAGKSTLVKIISGGLAPSSGRVLFDGAERHFASPAEAKAAGIETVYQDLSLATNVDVVANFFMGRELTRRVLGIPMLDERRMEAVTAAALSVTVKVRRSCSVWSTIVLLVTARSSSTPSRSSAAPW